MKTSFVAFMNKRGIACASDTDMTLYALSKREPVAVAVNSYSPIPWDTIINAYLRKGDIALHENFVDYAHDFADFLLAVEGNSKWKHLPEDDSNVIFLGYGTEDIFPSGVEIMVRYDDSEQKLKCDFKNAFNINHDMCSKFFTLGHFENVESVFSGCNAQIRKKLIEKQVDCFKKYKQRVTEVFKGTQYEQAVNEFVSEYDERQEFVSLIDKIVECHHKDLFTAIESFSIEDMVKVGEMFVDSNDQLVHLKNGGNGILRSTKELAVITRAEGVVWIKHCLYGV